MRRNTRLTPGRPEPADPGNAADLRISARPMMCRGREGHPSYRLGPLSTIERVAFSSPSPCDGATTIPNILFHVGTMKAARIAGAFRTKRHAPEKRDASLKKRVIGLMRARAPTSAGALQPHRDHAIKLHQVPDGGAHFLGCAGQSRSNVRFRESLIAYPCAQ